MAGRICLGTKAIAGCLALLTSLEAWVFDEGVTWKGSWTKEYILGVEGGRGGYLCTEYRAERYMPSRYWLLSFPT